MTLPPGARLGPYEILGLIGAGGMGEVYRSTDTKLHRDVAIKVLPAEVARDPERLARFRREATLLAALNHPNIGAIYGLEESGDQSYLVLELVEGEDLAERLKRGPIPLAEALEIAMQIAEGLEEAHEKGIVHRDLKPANVRLTPAGKVKVLDFGLARAFEPRGPAASPGELSQSPTALQQPTVAGAVLGTPDYMSPEQARGDLVDKRTDIWAFGVLLFEMVARKRPFMGRTATDTLAAVLTHEVHWDRLPESTPAEVRRVLRRCLEKNREHRLHDIADARIEIEEAGGRSGVPSLARRRGALGIRPGAWRQVALIVAGFLLASAGWSIWPWISTGDPALTKGPRGAPPVAQTTAPIQAASVAILPLTVTGGDDDDRAFADGIHDDMILQASKIHSLKVISRTSVMAFQESHQTLGEIARELRVASLIEGSMRRSGDRVRINVKLIAADSGQTLWGETYDRELTADNIFDIQSGIVERIAGSLKAALTAGERSTLSARPTADLAAYKDYLRGMALERELPQIEANLLDKVEAFQSAVDRDPSMAQGWAWLSKAHMHFYFQGFDRSPERVAAALDALETAETLAPDAPETAIARGYYYYWGFLDYERALEAFDRAEAGLPGNASVIAAKSFIQRRSGRLEASVESLERAVSLDPRNTHLIENLTVSYMFLQRWDDAREQAEVLRRLSPQDLRFQESLVRLFETGDPFPGLDRFREGRAYLDLLNLGITVRFARAYDTGEDLIGAFDDVQGEPSIWTSKSSVEGEWLSLAGRSGEASVALATARSELGDLLRSDPEDHRLLSTLGIVLAYQGDVEGARAAGERAVELMGYDDDALTAPWPRYALAGIYAITGATDDALGSLETLLTHHGMFSAAFVAQDPRFDSLRSDPRFAELLKKHGWDGTVHRRPEG